MIKGAVTSNGHGAPHLEGGHRCRCRCQSWRCCGGCGVSSWACCWTAEGAGGARWGSGSSLARRSPCLGSSAGALVFWEVQPFFGSSWKKAQKSAGQPRELQIKHEIKMTKDENKHFVCWIVLHIILIVQHSYKHTLSPNLLAAALSPLIMVSHRWRVMRERRTAIPRRLTAPHDGAHLPLVRQLPPDHTDLLLQGFGPARLADAVLPRIDLIKARLQVMQLLVQRQPSPVLWQQQVWEGQGEQHLQLVHQMDTKTLRFNSMGLELSCESSLIVFEHTVKHSGRPWSRGEAKRPEVTF